MPIPSLAAVSTIRLSMALKAAEGGIVGTVPLGYKICGYQSSARAEIDPSLSLAVVTAFRLAADPANSLRDVLTEMRAAGITGKRGKPLSLSTLQRMLNNPFYAGLVRSPLTGKTVEGLHEPIVTKQLFNRVQRNLRKRRCS